MTAAPPIVGTNTYISVADATALAADRLHAKEWSAAIAAHEAELAGARAEAEESGTPYVETEAVPVICRQALVTATALLDRLSWAGEPIASPPGLAWPRIGARDRQRRSVSPADVPPAIPVACAELAFHLLANEPHAPRQRALQMVMIGQSMETYFPSVEDHVPARIRLLVAQYLTASSKHSAEVRL